MKNRKDASRESGIGRREFVKIATGAVAGAATMGALGGVDARAAQAPASSSPAAQGVPWWAARPAGGKVGTPEAIDLHAHWSPEPYDKALADLGQPLAN